jgi:hypothetical protein
MCFKASAHQNATGRCHPERVSGSRLECPWRILSSVENLSKNSSSGISIPSCFRCSGYVFSTEMVMTLLTHFLQTTFYITESSAFRHHVLYFRQDDWETLCEPLIDRLCEKTFRQIEKARLELCSGFSRSHLSSAWSRRDVTPATTRILLCSLAAQGDRCSPDCESTTENKSKGTSSKTNRGIYLAHSHMGSARKAGAFDQSNSEDDVCYSKLRKGISLCSMSESAHTDVLRSKNNRTSLERLSSVPMRYTKRWRSLRQS